MTRRRAAPAVDPFEVVLDIAAAAGTEEAGPLVSAVREHVAAGGDVASWVGAVQLAREVGALDPDAAFYLLDLLTEEALGDFLDTDFELIVLGEELEASEAREELGADDAFVVGAGPSNWEALNRAWERRFDLLRAALLVRLREPGMGILLRRDVEAFVDRSRRGWGKVIPATREPEPPVFA